MSTGSHKIFERPDLRGRAHVFRDRAQAGALLAEMLAGRFEKRLDAVVLAIPAGGVPVAVPLAERLALPLDLAVVSKITLPWNTEVGYGAVAFDGSVHLNEPLLRQSGLNEAQVEAGIARTRRKVARRNADLRRGRSYAALSGANAVLVDDGLASGFTMRAAIAAVRAAGAVTITVAVPTGHEPAIHALAGSVETICCPNVRAGRSFAVADAYTAWSDVDEDTVRGLLGDAMAHMIVPAPARVLHGSDRHERSAMTAVDDFLTEKVLMDLAPPNAYIDGAAAAEHGAVRILERDAQHLRAEVEDWQIRNTELLVRDDALAWSCTCGEAEGHLCRHLVATALATWPEEPPDEVRGD